MIAYGAHCQWWDDKRKAATKDGTRDGLPCCPHCGGVLFEIDDVDWYKSVRLYDERGHPGYVAFVDWMRGRCFPTQFQATAAYTASTGRR